MRSPLPPHAPLSHVELEPGFHAMQCPETGGVWFQPRHYWA